MGTVQSPSRPQPRAPEAGRRTPHPYFPATSGSGQERLPEALRLLLPKLHRHSRPRREARRVPGGGLPQPRIRHVLQFLRRDEDFLPEHDEVDRTRRREAAHAIGPGNPHGREIERRARDDGRDGEDGADEIGGLRVFPDRAAGADAIRASQTGHSGRVARRPVRGESRRNAVRVPAVRDQGPEDIRPGPGVCSGQIRRRRGEGAAEARAVVKRQGNGESDGQRQAVRRKGFCDAGVEADGGGAVSPVRFV
ncbi:unnamed protein product [Cuscuta epithymum]|uniref:Uncharacterized protein n=1 Tax=Cuscuta epithymum TaxID=186058 RepID=A0AAV0GA29_9ASTE|nr:unnamed protein product [Cuscuta epithymum]